MDFLHWLFIWILILNWTISKTHVYNNDWNQINFFTWKTHWIRLWPKIQNCTWFKYLCICIILHFTFLDNCKRNMKYGQKEETFASYFWTKLKAICFPFYLLSSLFLHQIFHLLHGVSHYLCKFKNTMDYYSVSLNSFCCHSFYQALWHT